LLGNRYFIYSDKNYNELFFNRAGAAPLLFATMIGNDKIGDLLVNPQTKRLFVTVRDPSLNPPKNAIYIYDISDISNNNISFVTSINVTDGINPDNRILDLAIDQSANRIFALLPGTGGVATFIDSGGPLAEHDLSLIGVSQISSSFTDIPGEGKKLVFDPTQNLLYGIAKDSNEIFIIDTLNNAFSIKISRTDTPADELVNIPLSGLTLAINKKSGFIYKIW